MVRDHGVGGSNPLAPTFHWFEGDRYSPTGRASRVIFSGIRNRKILPDLAPFLLTESMVNGNLNR